MFSQYKATTLFDTAILQNHFHTIQVHTIKIIRSPMIMSSIDLHSLNGRFIYQRYVYLLMDIGEIILNEENPILREIWGYNYTRVVEDVCENTVSLINDQHNYTKKIDMFDWRCVMYKLRFKTVRSIDGRDHTFVSTENGGLDLLMKLIEPEKPLTLPN